MARWIIWGIVALVAVAALAGTVVYTEQPGFCPTCHEMAPYYDAWHAGIHEEVSCMDCHVESGLGNRLAHKFVALKEVWVHVTSDPTFPMYTAEVPDRRCTNCHETVEVEEPPPGFSHDEHAAAGACQGCHASTGHAVTVEALRSAGVLNETIVADLAGNVTGRLTTADPTPQLAPGHGDVDCGLCHDMPGAGCDYCHEPPENHFADRACSQCHVPGTPFEGAAFDHSGDLNCADCHDAPADHFTDVACKDCHTPGTPFDKATFDHPSTGEEHSYRSFPCEDCHPNGFATASCVKCHEGGTPEDD